MEPKFAIRVGGESEGDHHALATDVLPSASWAGREDELRSFVAWNHEINARWSARYPSRVQRFRHDFYVT